MSANRFETAALLKGSITEGQERALTSFAVNLGKENFGWYRAALRITAPIPRMSKGEAYRLIRAITRDLESALEGPQ